MYQVITDSTELYKGSDFNQARFAFQAIGNGDIYMNGYHIARRRNGAKVAVVPSTR